MFSLAEAFAVFSFCALFVMLITLYLSLMLSRFAGYCDDVSLLCEFVVPDFFFFFLLLACLMLPEPPVGFESSGFVLSEAAFCTWRSRKRHGMEPLRPVYLHLTGGALLFLCYCAYTLAA